MGFMNSLFDVIKREKPDHLAVCFDKGGSHARTEMYEDYKGNRDETPDVIRQSIPIIQDIINAIDVEEFKDVPVIVKGCARKPVPENAYLQIVQKLQPVAKTIMFGEACSSVPLFKKKKK